MRDTDLPQFSKKDEPVRVWFYWGGGENQPILKRIWLGIIIAPVALFAAGILCVVIWEGVCEPLMRSVGILERKKIEQEPAHPAPKQPPEARPITLPPGLVSGGKRPEGPVGPVPTLAP